MASPNEIAAVVMARTEGATAERERISAIVNCPEAKGKAPAALKLALTAGMSLDSAKGYLSSRSSTAALATAVAGVNKSRSLRPADVFASRQEHSALAAAVENTNKRPQANPANVYAARRQQRD